MPKKKKMYRQNPRIKQVVSEGEVNRLNEKGVVPIEKCWVVAENRIGTFDMTTALLEFIEWEMYQELIKNFMITGCQVSPDKQIIRYLAFSPLFDKHSQLEYDVKPPQYKIDVKEKPPINGKGKKRIVVTAKKMEGPKIVKVSKIVDSKGQKIKL